VTDPLSFLQSSDPGVAAILAAEEARQERVLNLIASENYASPAVRAAQGSVLTNKYAEGYPGKRYYGGCEEVDKAESLARERALKLFGAEHANVQPHSGTQANLAAYMVLLKHGETLMAMSLDHGGHLSHGHKLNFSGKSYRIVSYGVDPKTERIDMAEVRRIALTEKPKVIVAGASAYSRTLDFAAFGEIAKAAGAALVVDMAHIAGLVAAGLHPSPVPHAEMVTSTTHKTLRGPRGGLVLSKAVHAKTLDREVFPGMQGGPLMHVIAAKAVAFGEALRPEFKTYQQRILDTCNTLAEELVKEGFRIVSGGTDNHLCSVDLGERMSGREGERLLGEVGIVVNRNAIPFDKRPPMEASGLRLGTAPLCTRGLGVAEMRKVAGLIASRLKNPTDAKIADRVRGEAAALCKAFPIDKGFNQTRSL
jgi:glycine hydroxymethyltransferase